MARFLVVYGSQSSHCCFRYTVVDTDRPMLVEGGPPKYGSVCECFTEEDAIVVCRALNLAYWERRSRPHNASVSPSTNAD